MFQKFEYLSLFPKYFAFSFKFLFCEYYKYHFHFHQK